MPRLGTPQLPLLLLVALFLVVATACNSVSSSGGTQPPAGTPPPPGGGGGTGGGGGGGTGGGGGNSVPSGPDTFLATMFFSLGHNGGVEGQIKVDATANDGAVNYNSVAAKGDVLVFCPYLSQSVQDCFDVFTFPQSGTSFNFTFPRKGAFAGIFEKLWPGAAFSESTGLNFQSALLPASLLPEGVGEPISSAPLQRGVVTVTGRTVSITVTGTTPNTMLSAKTCDIRGPGHPQASPQHGSCLPLLTLTTDAQGNGSASAKLAIGPVFVVLVSDTVGVRFVSGFRVE